MLAALATSGDGADATFAEDVLLYLQRKKQASSSTSLGPTPKVGGALPSDGRVVGGGGPLGARPAGIATLDQRRAPVGTAAAAPPPPPPDAEGATLLACYAKNNEDLLAGFCGGVIADCRWEALGLHWEQHGRDEGRTGLRRAAAAAAAARRRPRRRRRPSLIPHHVTPSDHETPAAAADDAPPAIDLTATVAAAQRGATRALTTIFGTISRRRRHRRRCLCVLLLARRWRGRRRRWQRVQSDQSRRTRATNGACMRTDSRWRTGSNFRPTRRASSATTAGRRHGPSRASYAPDVAGLYVETYSTCRADAHRGAFHCSNLPAPSLVQPAA